MSFELSAAAKADLKNIGSHIARYDPDRAASYVEEILALCGAVSERPKAYRLRREWGKRLRAARFGQYLILFEGDVGAIRIMRVFHGKQDIRAILKMGNK